MDALKVSEREREREPERQAEETQRRVPKCRGDNRVGTCGIYLIPLPRLVVPG
jgi:hypothetical protein